jgi:hypothetical protein
MESTMQSCRINDGNRANFLVKMVMDDLNKYFDFKFTCPFPKQKFGCYNFVANANFLPPIFSLGGSIKVMVIAKFDGKLLGSKKTVSLFSYKILTEIQS